MRGCWTVLRWELRLLARGRALWAGVREQPWGAWGGLGFAALLISLVLTLATGDQLSRDRAVRLDGLVLATPVATVAYVAGKYLAALAALLALAGGGLALALLMDRFDNWRDPLHVFGLALFPPMGHSLYPPLGPTAYLAAWFWLVLPATLFGLALVFAGSAFARGRHPLLYVLVLLCWLGPIVIGEGVFHDHWPDLFDPTALQLAVQHRATGVDAAFLLHLTGGSPVPPPSLAAQVVALVRAHVPPVFPVVFFWNRLLLVGGAAALVGAAMVEAAQRRQGRR